MDNFQKEISFFLNHKQELCTKYPHQYVVIRNRTVVGSFDSYSEAFSKSIATYNRFDFYVALCVPQPAVSAVNKSKTLSKRVRA
jgi:hypothetical protein